VWLQVLDDLEADLAHAVEDLCDGLVKLEVDVLLPDCLDYHGLAADLLLARLGDACVVVVLFNTKLDHQLKQYTYLYCVELSALTTVSGVLRAL
jgi:hypothetical protein